MVIVFNIMLLLVIFEYFINKCVYMLLVVDEYGGLEGVFILEDLLEWLFGVDIVDEKDIMVSMCCLVKMMIKCKEWMLVKNVFDVVLDKNGKD